MIVEDPVVSRAEGEARGELPVVVNVGNPVVSVIVPTIDEAENLPLLLPRIAEAMRGRDYEVLIVDDNSRDGTAGVCEALGREYPLRLIVREKPWNGLSGAVLHGMAQARGEYFVVMDADLQHPPERLPAVLEPLERGEADFVLGSRYVEGGGTQEEWGWARRVVSRGATLLSRPFAGKVSDPMSGFFALKRETYAKAKRLTPIGYKIGLELMCKCEVKRVREVPIHFSTRARGESKLTVREQYRYLAHLSRLYDFVYPRASPVAKFLIVLACSWLIGAMVYALLVRSGVGLAKSAAGAYPVAIVVVAAFHFRYVRTQRTFLPKAAGKVWRDFLVIALVEWAASAGAAAWIVWRVSAPRASEVFAIAFGIGAAVRYVLRKEMLMDIRGLRKEIRRDELTG
jgi:dolichol-phosphate mannosyltransferase